MRHRKKLNHLGRTSSHRKAMLANMASSLILHKRITTTLAKAKALRIYVEPLITKSKIDSTHSRRMVFSYIKDKQAVAELFREVSPKVGDRPGGYTRILKTGNRLGDNADMCIIELVDFNENMLAATTESKPAAKRSRRGRGKKSGAEAEKTGETLKSAEKPEKTEAGQDNAVKAEEEEKPAAGEKEPASKEGSGTEEGVKGKPEGSGEKEEIHPKGEEKEAREEETKEEAAAKEENKEEKKEAPAKGEKKEEKEEAPAKGEKKEAGEEKNDDQDEEESGKEGDSPDEKKPE